MDLLRTRPPSLWQARVKLCAGPYRNQSAECSRELESEFEISHAAQLFAFSFGCSAYSFPKLGSCMRINSRCASLHLSLFIRSAQLPCTECEHFYTVESGMEPDKKISRTGRAEKTEPTNRLVEGKRHRRKRHHEYGKRNPADNGAIATQRHMRIDDRWMAESPESCHEGPE